MCEASKRVPSCSKIIVTLKLNHFKSWRKYGEKGKWVGNIGNNNVGKNIVVVLLLLTNTSSFIGASGTPHEVGSVLSPHSIAPSFQCKTQNRIVGFKLQGYLKIFEIYFGNELKTTKTAMNPPNCAIESCIHWKLGWLMFHMELWAGVMGGAHFSAEKDHF